jgi:hypothetical protein
MRKILDAFSARQREAHEAAEEGRELRDDSPAWEGSEALRDDLNQVLRALSEIRNWKPRSRSKIRTPDRDPRSEVRQVEHAAVARLPSSRKPR